MEGDFRIEQWLVQPQPSTVVSPDNKTVQLEPKVTEVPAYRAEHVGDILPQKRILNS